MEFINHLLPAIEHLGAFSYWIILLSSLLESVAFIGAVFPGAVFLLFAGFLAAQGSFELGDAIWFAALGAIMGNGISYWLGTKGIRFFRNENKILKESHLEMGKRFFKKHGNKSILLGSFVGPVRAMVPFVAGLFNMRKQSFLIWSTLGAFLWTTCYLLLGYFFGGIIKTIELWSARAGLFILALICISAIAWFLSKKSSALFAFVYSVAVSIKKAVASNADIRALVRKHPRIFSFLKKRLHRGVFSGLPLTLFCIAFLYTVSLFAGVVEDIITSDSITTFDVRFANMLFVSRNADLVSLASWITLLGDMKVVGIAVLAISLLLWIFKKQLYILPLWLTIFGSELITLAGKMIIHRPRPLVALYAESGFSFPSGHATIAVALYGFLAYILFRESKQWKSKTNSVVICVLIILLIGFSRLYLGVHYLSDVWGGYLSGLLWLIIGIAITEWMRTEQK